MANVTRVVLAVDSTQVRQGTADLRAMQGQGQRTQTAVAQVGRAIAGIAAGVSLVATTRQVVAYADAWQNAANSLRQVTSSSEQLTDVQNKLMSVSKETRSGFESTANLYSRLTRATSEMGLSQSDVIDLTTTINKSFAVSGATASESAAAITQLSQGLAAGALRGDEFNSVAEQAPALMRAIADSTNMTIGELRAFAATGGITAEIVVTALQKASSQIDDQFSKSVATFGQSWVSATDNMMAFVGRSTAVNSAMAAAGSAIVTISNNLHIMGNALTVVAIVGVGKLVSSVAASTVALYAQAVAATRATVSVDALGMATARTTVAQTAMAAASRAGAAALLFLGGPVGIAVIAAGAIYAFREELGLVKPPAEDAMKAVNDLAAGIDNLTAAEARNRLGGVADKLGEIMLAAKEQQKVVDELNKMSGAAGKNAGMSAIVERETQKLKLLQDQAFALAKTATTLQKTIAGDDRAKAFAAGAPGRADAESAAQRRKSALEELAYLREENNLIQIGTDLKVAQAMVERDKLAARLAGQGLQSAEIEEYIALTTAIDNAAEAQRNQADATKDTAEASKDAAEASKDMAKNSIDALRTMQGVFDRGSKGYKQLEAAIQVANTASATHAVLNQAAGNPYLAFANMATMAAAVASLGYSVGSLGGSLNDDSAAAQATQGTGTALGMAMQKSESIANAVEITASATTELVGINRSMLNALTGLQQGISGATGQIARGTAGTSFSHPGVSFKSNLFGDLTSGVKRGAESGAGQFLSTMTFGLSDVFVGLFGGALDGLGKILGGKSKVTNQGIQILGGSMSDLMNDALVQSFQSIKYKKHAGSSTRTSESLSAVDQAVSDQFALVFQGIADSVSAGAVALGMRQSDIDAALSAYQIETIRISTLGLDSEAQQAELEAVFGTIFDGLAGSVVPFIEQFQTVGEGLGETLARVATNVQVTEEAARRLGFTAANLGAEQFAQLSMALVDVAGGLDSFIGGMGRFVELFASEQYKSGLVSGDLATVLGGAGLAIPKTRDAMWELMQTLDAGTESGRAQIAALLSASALADAYYDTVEKEEAARAAKIQAQVDQRAALQRQIDDMTMTEEQKRQRELDGLGQGSRALQERIYALQDAAEAEKAAAQSARDYASTLQEELGGISSALDTLRGASGGGTAARSSAMATLRNALLTGNLTGTGAAAGVAANIDTAGFSTLADFQREQGQTIWLLDQLEREGKMQLSAAEQQVAYLESIDGNIARMMGGQAATVSVPGFASGGAHGGGLRIVGENGPELESTGPSRITSNSELSRALSANAELVQEIRELKGYIRQTTKNTGESRDILNRWNKAGIPEEREQV